MRNIKGKPHRMLAVLLAAAMMVTSLPQTSVTAAAQETEDSVLETEQKTTLATVAEETESAEEDADLKDAGEDDTGEDDSETEMSQLMMWTESSELDEANRAMENADEAAAASESSDADFTISNGTLTKYNGTATEIVIPDSVVTIGSKVFQNNTTITSVKFSDSVKTIGASAFAGCTSLAKVELNEGLVTIETYAFSKASLGRQESNGTVTYGTLTIPSTVQSIGQGAFYQCKYLGKVVFEDDTEKNTLLNISSSIGSGCATFGECVGLKSVELPERLKEIPTCAFYKDAALETVTFGSKLETIGEQAFSDCSSLESIELPAAVTTVDKRAFSGCTSLAAVKLNEGLVTIGTSAFSGVAFGRQENNGTVTYGELTIPSTVQSIGEGAFYNCKYLSKVVFKEDAGNTSLTISSSIGSGLATFGECVSLKSVELPDRLTEIPVRAFYEDTALEMVTFGSKLETIGERAFFGCTSLAEVKLNEGLVTIGTSAFYGAALGRQEDNGTVTCGELTIPSTVRSIGKGAFYNCKYLGKVVFEDDAEKNILLTISSEIGSGQATFGECVSLKSVELPDRLKEIPTCAFYKDTALETVTFGSKLETIGEQAFLGCSSLESIELPAAVTTVDERAFSGCTSLAAVKLNEGLVTIGTSAFSRAAFGRQESNGTVTCGELTIPSTVRSIGEGAFYNCKYLGKVVFEDDAEKNILLTISSSIGLGLATFGECGSLKSVELPERLTEIPTCAFYKDTALETVTFGSKLETIGEQAFLGCSSLERVILPESLTTILSSSFANDEKLTALYIPKSVTTIDDYALKNSKNVTIYGVKGSYAETFAKEKGFPFKTKDGLGLNVTGISLSPKNITRAGAEVIGKTIQLTATVKPSTAQNKQVTYSSNNTAVATVDSNGLVTLTGYGEAVITATAADKELGEQTATCTIKVLKTWTDEEIQTARETIAANNDFLVLTNTCDSLQDDITIQTDGTFTAAWRLPYTVQPGANSDYDIVLQKDGYQDTTLSGITVKGVRVDGISISGTDVLQAGQSGTLQAEISMTGDDVCTKEELGKILTYNIDWKSAKTANLTVSGSTGTEATIKGVKAGNGITVTATLALNKGGSKVETSSSNKGEQWFTADTKVNVLAAGIDIVTGIEITAKDATENVVALPKLAELTETAIETPAVYTLTAVAKAGEEPVAGCALSWKSSDTKVADIKVKDGVVTLTVKSLGSSTITATAAGNGGYTESFRVTVKDSTPRLQTDSVTLNLNLKTPEALITLLPSDGFTVDDTSLKLVTTAGDTSAFSIVKKEGTANQYSIGVNTSEIKTGKYKLKLQAKTTAGEAAPHELALTVQVVKQSPKVTITQESLNLYEKDGVGKLQITTDTDAKISSITFTPADTASGVYLEQKAVDVVEGSLTYQLNGGTKDNYKQAKVQGILTIKFADYGDAADYVKKISLKVNKNLPKFTAAALTLYPDTAADTAQVQITEQAAGQLTTNAGYTVTADDAKIKSTYTITSEGSTLMSVKALKGAKNATVKLNIKNTSWIDGITATTSLKVKIGKTPALSFSAKTVILNTNCVVDGQCSSVEVTPYIEGFEDKEFSSVSFTGSNAKSEQVRTDGLLSLTYADGVILASIEDETVTAGKYTYNVKAVTTDSLSVSGKLTVSVVTKSAADISLKASGSIDLLNRSGSGITYKITTKNYTDTIVSVDLIGQNADRFALTSNADGSVTLRANAGKSLAIKTAYPVTLQVTYKSGVKLTKTVKVTPKQTVPKFTANVKNVTLFESVAGAAYAKDITFTGSKLYTDISKIELVDGQGAFDYTYGEDGSGSLYVKENASAKTGKTYTLKFAVTLKDAAANGAPVYVTMKVNYRK